MFHIKEILKNIFMSYRIHTVLFLEWTVKQNSRKPVCYPLLSVEIQHILRYNLLIIMRGDCKLWGFLYVRKLQILLRMRTAYRSCV